MAYHKKVYINTEKIRVDPYSLINHFETDRSDGKSTDIIRSIWKDFKADGRAGVICRRWTGEVTDLYARTLCTLLKGCAERGEVEGVGGLTFKGTPKKYGIKLFSDSVYFALIVPLSRGYAIKSILDVKTEHNLYFDEYQPLNGRFLKNEVAAIMELFATIDRDTDTNKIFIYSNRISTYNPLFAEYGIIPRNGISKWRNDTYILLRLSNKGNADTRKQSRFGKLIEGTDLDDYYTGGEYLTEQSNFIWPQHTRNALPLYLTCSNGKDYAVYFAANGFFVIDYAPADVYTRDWVHCTTAKNAGLNGGMWLGHTVEIFKCLKNAFQRSQLFCKTERIFYEVKELWDMLK